MGDLQRKFQGAPYGWREIDIANVVAQLERMGARQADTPDQVCPGDTVIIRSHGETKQVLERLEEMGARCVNATCPNVLHIQRVVSRADEAGPLFHHQQIVIFDF